MKKTIITLITIISFILLTFPVSAHMTVSPQEVGVAKRQVFTLGFAVEKDIPTTGVRLVIPGGIESVTPYLKEGWEIDLKKDSEGNVTEISWTGGSVPNGYRDQFLFNAQVPADETTLVWKGYQTYSDGSVVAWDQDPKKAEEHGAEEENTEEHEGGPWSETNIVNDLNVSDTEGGGTSRSSTPVQNNLPLMVSITSLVISLVVAWRSFRKQ